MNASRYVDILFVGSNVVTLTGTPSITDSAESVRGEEQLDLDTLLALTLNLVADFPNALLIIYTAQPQILTQTVWFHPVDTED